MGNLQRMDDLNCMIDIFYEIYHSHKTFMLYESRSAFRSLRLIATYQLLYTNTHGEIHTHTHTLLCNGLPMSLQFPP